MINLGTSHRRYTYTSTLSRGYFALFFGVDVLVFNWVSPKNSLTGKGQHTHGSPSHKNSLATYSLRLLSSGCSTPLATGEAAETLSLAVIVRRTVDKGHYFIYLLLELLKIRTENTSDTNEKNCCLWSWPLDRVVFVTPNLQVTGVKCSYWQVALLWDSVTTRIEILWILLTLTVSSKSSFNIISTYPNAQRKKHRNATVTK